MEVALHRGTSESCAVELHGSYALHGVRLRVSGDDPLLFARLQGILEHFGLAAVEGAQAPATLRIDLRRGTAALVPKVAREVARQDGICALRAGNGLWLAAQDLCFRLDLAAGRAEGTLCGAPLALRKDVVIYALLLLLRRRGLFGLHASAVVRRGAGYLLVGGSGSGKSTSTYALARRGWNYLGDDALLLHPVGNRVEALALRRDLCLDPALATRFPEIALDGEPGQFAGKGKHRLDMRARFPKLLVDRCLPRVLVFPEVVLEAESRVVPLPTAEILLRLVAQSAVLALDPKMVPRHMEILGRLARQAPGYRLLAGRDLEANPERVADLLEAPQPPPRSFPA